MKKLFRIFFEFFKLSLFVIGGGYAIIAVADGSFAKKKWTKEGELMENLPVFQMIPGLIATHVAVYVGRKLAGVAGAVAAVAAVALPSIVIFSAVSAGYSSLPLGNATLQSAFVGLRAALSGIIAVAIAGAWRKTRKDSFYYIIAAVSALALVSGVSVPTVLLAAMIAGVAAQFKSAGGGRKVFCSSWLALILFLKYGSFCFGGGFVLVPMYLEDFVGAAAPYLNISESEFSNLMSLSQMTPGPIGINGATYFGFKIAGVAGAVVASVLMLLPGSVMVYFALSSIDRFSGSRIVSGILRGARPASLTLMIASLWSFVSMSAFDKESGEINFTAAGISLAVATIMMKKKINAVSLIIVSALAAAALRADDVSSAKFPDADVVVVEEIEKVSYSPDGTSRSTAESWTKILTEKGRRDESSQSLSYSKRYGEAKIVYVGIAGADGVEREVDVSATTSEATDNSSMESNIYDPLDRRIVCTVPGLKIGDVLHLKVERKTHKPRCVGKWADISIMEWSRPILKSTYEITAPRELPLRKIAVRNPLGNMSVSKRVLADGSTVHHFSCTNSPQAFPEPDMPPLYTQVQNVRVSTSESWREISEWYWDLCVPHLERTNAAMTNKVAEIGGGISGDALMRALFKFVSQDVRYMGLTMEDTSPGYAPHDVNVTFDNRYGVCRDKAGLLVAMLRIAGFKAYPVLINVGAKMDSDVPQPYFNHAVVAVEKPGGGYALMDPTNENTRDIFPSYLSDKSYLVCRPGGERLMTTDVLPSAVNSVCVESSGKVSADGSMVLENSIAFGGVNDTIYRGALARRTPDEREDLFGRIVAKFAPGAELLSCDIEPKDIRDTEKPLKVKLFTRIPEARLNGRERIELILPMISKTLGYANFLLEGSTSLDRRKYPLSLDTTAQTVETLTLELGGNFGAVVSLPPEITTADGYDYRRRMSYSRGVLKAERKLAVSKTEFSPDEYLKLKEKMKRVEAAERKLPVFAADTCADADVEILLNKSETSFLSAGAERATEWVTTNETVKRVLTYQGKKSSSELKYSYNPVWKEVKIISAVVSNLNGRVTSVSPHEINVHDAGWVASAPRYAPSRLMVVNLPSVEVGSVVSVVTETKVKGSPLPFYGVFSFDSKLPLRRKIVRVGEWRREVSDPVRLPDEPLQPAARLWRDVQTVSMCDWSDTAERLKAAVEIPEVDALPEGAFDLKSIRDWMARHVKVAGPDLYELPIGRQLTAPSTVLSERYATRLDYVRTLASLLEKAGYDVDIVFAANDSSTVSELKELDVVKYPNPGIFRYALCRVRVKKGGFMGIGGESHVYYLGTENEYTPIETTAYDGATFFDPVAEEFGRITVADDERRLKSETLESSRWHVRENGSVDIEVKTSHYGPGVGSFRKRFAEILPEEQSRYYQRLLGGIAEAATATGELLADFKGYPGTLSFKCYVPEYATVNGDSITIRLPRFETPLPVHSQTCRKTPFRYPGCDKSTEEVEITFPEGYTRIEYVPQTMNEKVNGFTRAFETEVVEGRLKVKVVSRVEASTERLFKATDYAAQKDLVRRADAESARTIVVRRK